MSGLVPLFLKGLLPGSADLFAQSVRVEGYTTKEGTYVAPHTAIRRKRVVTQAPRSAHAQVDLFSNPQPIKATPRAPAKRDDSEMMDLFSVLIPEQVHPAVAPAPDPDAWSAADFSAVTARLASSGQVPFSAEDVAKHWPGHTADEAGDLLHAHGAEYAIDASGEHFSPMDHYLANTTPGTAIAAARGAERDGRPGHITERLHRQAKMITDAADAAWETHKATRVVVIDR